MKNFDAFRDLVEEHDELVARECTQYHWQVRDRETNKVLVNYWPTKRKLDVGSGKTRVVGDPLDIVKWALGSMAQKRESAAQKRREQEEKQRVVRSANSRDHELVKAPPAESKGKPTADQIIERLHSEYRHWRDMDVTENDDLAAIQIGATGALSNVIAYAHGLQVTGGSKDR